jgi:hypothetical protein
MRDSGFDGGIKAAAVGAGLSAGDDFCDLVSHRLREPQD